MSVYTGLSCTFSYIIREHGSKKIYDWVYATAQKVATQEPPRASTIGCAGVLSCRGGIR